MLRQLCKAVISIFLSISAFFSGLAGQITGKPYTAGTQVDMSKFELVWSDEFDGDALDRSKWDFSWWITERKGGYWHEDMVRVEDGNLVISAEYKDEALPYRYTLERILADE